MIFMLSVFDQNHRLKKELLPELEPYYTEIEDILQGWRSGFGFFPEEYEHVVAITLTAPRLLTVRLLWSIDVEVKPL